jgi:hypothetical protein
MGKRTPPSFIKVFLLDIENFSLSEDRCLSNIWNKYSMYIYGFVGLINIHVVKLVLRVEF